MSRIAYDLCPSESCGVLALSPTERQAKSALLLVDVIGAWVVSPDTGLRPVPPNIAPYRSNPIHLSLQVFLI